MNSTNQNSKHKILVVDDDTGILEAISLILEDAGYQVQSASNGNNIVKKVEKFEPDIVLLDVLLSGYDGRIICKQLKDNPKTQRIPVIMISAHPTAKETIKHYKANAFLAKPFGSNELLASVKKFLKG